MVHRASDGIQSVGLPMLAADLRFLWHYEMKTCL